MQKIPVNIPRAKITDKLALAADKQDVGVGETALNNFTVISEASIEKDIAAKVPVADNSQQMLG